MLNKESSPNDLRWSDAHYRAKHAATRFPRQRCRRPTPRSCAAGANGTNMCQWWSARSNALTNNSNSSKGYRREGQLTFAPRKPDILTPPRLHLPCRSLSVATASRRLPCFLTASRRWPWRAATSAWPKRFFRDRTRQHLACFARCPPKVQSSRGRRKNLTFSFGKHARTTCISLFPGPGPLAQSALNLWQASS